jgi:2-C-methyl-D-erythritol 4-phosphate cytidylyltransferase
VTVALVVAAGRGERLGSGGPKALVSLGGRPMLEWSVAALQSVPGIDEIVVALPPDELDVAPRGVTAVPGGEARSQSVREALRASGGGDPVIVHDAARPLARGELFIRAVDELERSGADAVVAAAPVSDTIKEVDADGHTVRRTLDRSRLWAVQTPQVFRRVALHRALTDASDELLATATDDAWLIERAGGSVRVIDAGPLNIKVTTATDLRLAELLLSERADDRRGGSDRLT